MLTETKLFLFLLLSGAVATECVVPKDGGAYYIKLKVEGKDNYSYAFGTSRYPELQALPGKTNKNGNNILWDAMELQEFTFKDNTLFSEFTKEGKETVKYVVGLKQQTKGSLLKWDGKLYVTADKKFLRSSKVKVTEEGIVIGNDLPKRAQVIFTKEEGNVYAPAQGKKVEINEANDSKICFVTKKTANEDYAKMMTNGIHEQLTSIMTEGMMEAIDSRIKETAKVPFNKEKLNEVYEFASKLIDYNEALEKNSAEIQKILKEKHCEKTEAEIRDLALLDYKPEEEFNLEKITKLIMNHPKQETIPNNEQVIDGDNPTKDHQKTVDVATDSKDNIDDGNTEETNEDPSDSGAQSFVAVTTLVASLFFL